MTISELNLNRYHERSMRIVNEEINKTSPGSNGIVIDETKATLLGVIIDDFENHKEIFIPAKKTGKKK